MKIVSWNMEYWWNHKFRDPVSKEKWRKECTKYLYSFIDLDEMVFLLLQETAPYYFFELGQEKTSSYIYSKKLSENLLLIYNEVSSEIKSNPWGNAIIINKAIKNHVCSLESRNSEIHRKIKGFMYNTFELLDGNKITIINFYNKINNRVYPMLDVDNNLFEIENDIKDLLNSNNNLVVFAGDFNTGSNNSNSQHKERYDKLCNKLSDFTDISNGKPELNINTSFWYDSRYTKKGHFLRNDFCFVNKLSENKYNFKIEYPVENIENEWKGEVNAKKWHGLSDHCPIIIDFTF